MGESLQESHPRVEFCEGAGVAEGIAQCVVEAWERGDAAEVWGGREG